MLCCCQAFSGYCLQQLSSNARVTGNSNVQSLPDTKNDIVRDFCDKSQSVATHDMLYLSLIWTWQLNTVVP